MNWHNNAAIPRDIWPVIIYIAVFATAIPYLLNAYALLKVNPSVVTVFIYLQTIIGVVLAAIFLDERLDIRFVIAALLIFLGVYLTTRRASPNTVATIAEVPPSM